MYARDWITLSGLYIEGGRHVQSVVDLPPFITSREYRSKFPMRLVQYFILLSVLSPRPAVYIKGHSHAANQVRRNIATYTCFSSGAEPKSSAGILHVDHILGMSGRSWVVMVL